MWVCCGVSRDSLRAGGEAEKVALFFLFVSRQTKMIFCYCFNHVNQLLATRFHLQQRPAQGSHERKKQVYATVILY